MPITITEPPTVSAPLGPGFLVGANTSFVGPLPTGSFWRATLLGSDGETAATVTEVASNDHAMLATLGFDYRTNTLIYQPASHSIEQGQPGTLKVELFQTSSTLIESTTMPVKQDYVTGNPYWQALVQQYLGSGGGGLTTVQAQQLEEVHGQTVLTTLLDQLTLTELTAGPQGGTVSANLVAWIWGVIVRIATVPDDLVPNTPDGDYWVPSLAVVRLYRGADLFLRIPIHTSSKMVNFSKEGFEAAVSQLLPTQWLAQLSVQVSFRDGVTGQVFLMKLP